MILWKTNTHTLIPKANSRGLQAQDQESRICFKITMMSIMYGIEEAPNFMYFDNSKKSSIDIRAWIKLLVKLLQGLQNMPSRVHLVSCFRCLVCCKQTSRVYLCKLFTLNFAKIIITIQKFAVSVLVSR